MATIKNINDQYGESVEFSADDLISAIAKMAESISACGFEVVAESLNEGVDYEIIA